MLHELVFLGCHLQFATYPYSCKILQPYVVATVRIHSDAIFSSISASQMKTFIKNQCSSTNSVFYKQLSVRTHQTDTCETALAGLRCYMNRSQMLHERLRNKQCLQGSGRSLSCLQAMKIVDHHACC